MEGWMGEGLCPTSILTHLILFSWFTFKASVTSLSSSSLVSVVVVVVVVVVVAAAAVVGVFVYQKRNGEWIKLSRRTNTWSPLVFPTEKLRYSLLNLIFSLDYWSQTVLKQIKSFPRNASERVHSQLPDKKYFQFCLLLLMCWRHIPCWERKVPFLSGICHGVSVVAGAHATGQ